MGVVLLVPRGQARADLCVLSEEAISKAMTATHVYIGTMPCGCNVAACVDDPIWAKDTAKDVADYIKRGYAVSRVLLTELAGAVKLGPCVHNRTSAKPDAS